MDLSRFFIDRPIFAAVISLVIFIVGLISMFQLPISEYPEVVPPSVVVTAQFPGANPKVISETVAAPLEEQINGVEDMLYMASQATTDGLMTLTVTFKIGTDPDKAQQLVQNRVSQAEPRLPNIVRQFGVTVVKSAPDLTMVVHLFSPDTSYDTLYLANYVKLNIKDRIQRISGVGRAEIFGGADYSMRVWLDPKKLAERQLSGNDVVAAIREQNVQVAAGVIGAAPMRNPVDLQLSINTKGRLKDESEFGDIIVKVSDDGAITYLKDVSRITLDAQDYALRSLLDNDPAVAIAVFQQPGSNALDISDTVRATMKELQENFPAGLDYNIVYDPTTFVRGSIEAVISTLLEAVLLVVLVVIIFLQTWRASIIPLLAVPVSIIGTFAFMQMLGISINALSLFGLVLAIGVVVDDAIVVVENVERNISEGLTPRAATYQAMREVSGPIIVMSLVLIAVFVPIAFVSGLTGQFYKQFATTIAISTFISMINSLTLSPALAAMLLQSEDAPKDRLTRIMDKLFGGFFGWFNRVFKRAGKGYSHRVEGLIKRRTMPLFIYAVFIGITGYLFMSVPTGYVPAQDKQYLIGFAQLPDGSSLDRTEEVIRQMSEISLKHPGVANAVAFPGLSINGFTNSSSAGIVFLPLKDFDERSADDMSAGAIAGAVNAQFSSIKDAFVLVLPPPPILGLGTSGGFKLELQNRGDLPDAEFAKIKDAVLGQAYQSQILDPMQTYSGFQINVPQLEATLDRVKAKQLGLNITDIFDTMQIYLGSLYVNDFNKFGKTYRVIVQADDSFRDRPDDIGSLEVRNNRGDMVPLASVLNVSESFGLERAQRYNAYPSADINSGPKAGFSSGEAQAEIVRIIENTVPKEVSYEWTELTYQQILAGDSTLLVFPLCVLLVFLVLAAQYESMTLPLAVILIVPMCLFSAIVGVWLTGGDNNIFTQIGFIVLVGLACKNAILIVEFARELEIGGMKPAQAAIESARLRLRPILMTSFAFIMGVLPLVLASGAGAEMRYAMGLAVFSGMVGVTLFGLLLTPVFYVVLRTLFYTPLHSASDCALGTQDEEGGGGHAQ